MKKPLYKHYRFWFALILAAIIAFLGIELIIELNDTKVKNTMSKEQCQTFVNDTLRDLPSSSVRASQYILDNTNITVDSITYSNEKNIILSCSYTTLDTKGALLPKLPSLATKAFEYVQNKPNASGGDIGINCLREPMLEIMKNAQPVSGKVTLQIYEAPTGMMLYLDDTTVDQVTGGIVTVRKAIDAIKNVEFDGTSHDIKNNNTLRTGIDHPVALDYYLSEKPAQGWLLQAIKDFKSDFYDNFIDKGNYIHLVRGLGVTLLLTLCAALFGIVLGFIIAIIRCTNQMTGTLRLPDAICRFYLTIMRGTPVMVQLLIIHFVFLAPMKISAFLSAIICFGLNSGAYVAEIVRGGIMSVDKGQIEAGRSLGFNYVQTMVHFIVPQAFKAILPSLANEFITLLKESSVAFTIGVADLTKGGNTIRSTTFSPFLPLLAVALIYLILVMILSKLVSLLERRLAKSDH